MAKNYHPYLEFYLKIDIVIDPLTNKFQWHLVSALLSIQTLTLMMKCFSVDHFYLVTSIGSFRQFRETLWSIRKVFLKVQTKARWSTANLLDGRSLGSGRRLGLDLGGLVAAAEAATAAVEALLLHRLQLLVRGRDQFLKHLSVFYPRAEKLKILCFT